MNTAIERLLALRVGDVMSKRVVSVSLHDTMDKAARSLLEHAISGAPVVDAQQFCVGVLSAIDFVKQQDCTCTDAGGIKRSLVQKGAERPWRIDVSPNDRVADHMSSIVQSIAADKSLLTAARTMCAQHIHRLPVLDDRGRPIGMLTALDIVASLITAIEEQACNRVNSLQTEGQLR